MSAWLTIPNIFPQSFIKNGLNLTSLFMGHLMQLGKGIQGELRCKFELLSCCCSRLHYFASLF